MPSSLNTEDVLADKLSFMTNAALRIQRAFRKRIYVFNRQRLIERLNLEIQLGVMGARFWVYIILFGLLVSVLRLPYETDCNLLIRNYLYNRFSFDTLSSVTTQTDLQEFVSALTMEADRINPVFGMQRQVYGLSSPLLIWNITKGDCDEVVKATLTSGNCPAYCNLGNNCQSPLLTFTNSLPYTEDVQFGSFFGRGYVLSANNKIPEFKYQEMNGLILLLPLFSPAGKGASGTTVAGYMSIKWDENMAYNWQVNFFEKLESTTVWIILSALCFLTVVIEIGVDYWLMKQQGKIVRSRTTWGTFKSMFRFVLESTIMIGMAGFFAYNTYVWYDSEAKFKAHAKNMATVDWTIGARSGFSAINDFYYGINEQQNTKMVGVICLYLIMLRIAQSMSMHPRIALFVDTFTLAGQEVLHFIGTFAMMFFVLAIVAWMVVGKIHSHYQSYTYALWSQWELLSYSQLNVDDWNSDWRMASYFIVYCVLVLFCLLNFFMAIIIDTYLKVRERVETQITEQTIFKDLLDTFRAEKVFLSAGLPSRFVIITALNRMSALKTVTVINLINDRVMNISQCKAFVRFYHQYGFLRPDEQVFNRQEIESKRWDKVLSKVGDHLLGAELDCELLESYKKDLDGKLGRIDDRLDKISQSLGIAISSDSADAQEISMSTIIKRKRNIFDEYRARKLVDKQAVDLIKKKKLKDYVEESQIEAHTISHDRKPIQRRQSNTFKGNKRRTIMKPGAIKLDLSSIGSRPSSY